MSAIAVDWSGAKRPTGKIWIAKVSRGLLSRLEPLASRDEAIAEVLQHLRSDEKGVAGLDFGFSLPVWFCRKNSVQSAFELWALVEREGERWLRECPWPFWGRPGKARPEIESHLRRTEEQVGLTRGIGPKSIFQIGGAGAVGTGSLRGMPFLSRIREEGFCVWPFDSPRLPLVIEMSKVFSPAPLGPLTLRNRLIHSATFECMATEDGLVTEPWLSYVRFEVGTASH